ncbi:MAG: type II secretion system F family protein [Clostridium sp.]
MWNFETRFLSERLKNGEALSLAIKDVDGLDRRLALMVLTGEETGKLDVMLKNTADSFEYEADMAVSRLVSLVEPVMILGLGAVIGAVLLGIMVPLWRMYGTWDRMDRPRRWKGIFRCRAGRLRRMKGSASAGGPGGDPGISGDGFRPVCALGGPRTGRP